MFHNRRVFLINKTFQLRFAFYVCSWLIALSFVYPLIIFNLFNYLMRYLAMDPMGPAIANLEKTREELLWLLVTMELILISLTFLISIFMSHKIAGPLYKLKKFFQIAKDGNLDQKLVFRKRDYFQDLVPEYNDMLDVIHGRFKSKSAHVQKAIGSIEKTLGQVSLEARVELEGALRSLIEAEKS